MEIVKNIPGNARSCIHSLRSEEHANGDVMEEGEVKEEAPPKILTEREKARLVIMEEMRVCRLYTYFFVKKSG